MANVVKGSRGGGGRTKEAGEEVMEEERGCRIVTRGGGGAETGGKNRAVGVIAERADRNFKEIEKDVVMMTDGVRVPKRRFHLPKDSLQE